METHNQSTKHNLALVKVKSNWNYKVELEQENKKRKKIDKEADLTQSELHALGYGGEDERRWSK